MRMCLRPESLALACPESIDRQAPTTATPSCHNSVENPLAFILLGGAQAWPYAMAAPTKTHRLSFSWVGRGTMGTPSRSRFGTLSEQTTSGSALAFSRAPAGAGPALTARGENRTGEKNGDCHGLSPIRSPSWPSKKKHLARKRIGWLYPIFRDVHFCHGLLTDK